MLSNKPKNQKVTSKKKEKNLWKEQVHQILGKRWQVLKLWAKVYKANSKKSNTTGTYGKAL